VPAAQEGAERRGEEAQGRPKTSRGRATSQGEVPEGEASSTGECSTAVTASAEASQGETRGGVSAGPKGPKAGAGEAGQGKGRDVSSSAALIAAQVHTLYQPPLLVALTQSHLASTQPGLWGTLSETTGVLTPEGSTWAGAGGDQGQDPESSLAGYSLSCTSLLDASETGLVGRGLEAEASSKKAPGPPPVLQSDCTLPGAAQGAAAGVTGAGVAGAGVAGGGGRGAGEAGGALEAAPSMSSSLGDPLKLKVARQWLSSKLDGLTSQAGASRGAPAAHRLRKPGFLRRPRGRGGRRKEGACSRGGHWGDALVARLVHPQLGLGGLSYWVPGPRVEGPSWGQGQGQQQEQEQEQGQGKGEGDGADRTPAPRHTQGRGTRC